MEIIRNKRNIIIFFTLCFIFIFILNALTPYGYDDYSYKNVIGENRSLESFSDIISSQVNHWYTWGGRSVAHFIAQFFLLFETKLPFNFCNSIMYLLLIWLITNLSRVNEAEDILVKDYIFIFILSWFAFAKWGETFLWLIGSCNYLWTTVFILLYIYYVQRFNNKGIPKSVLIFLLGILAGWSNENAGAGIVTFSILNIFYQKFIKKNQIKTSLIVGLLGTIIGFVMMIIAPGNYVRLAGVNLHNYESINFFVTVFARFFIYLGVFIYSNIPLLIISMVVLIKFKSKIKLCSINTPILIYFGSMIISQCSMVISPEFPPRAMTIVTVFFLLSTVIFINYNKWQIKNIYNNIFKIVMILFILSSIYVLIDNTLIYRDLTFNIPKAIQEYKEKNIDDIIIESHSPGFDNHSIINPFSHYYSKDETNWFNITEAKRYGVSTIREK